MRALAAIAGAPEGQRDRRHQDLVSRGEQAVALSQLGRHWEARRAGEAAARDGLRDRALFVALGESSFHCGLVEDSEDWMRKALAVASDTCRAFGARACSSGARQARRGRGRVSRGRCGRRPGMPKCRGRPHPFSSSSATRRRRRRSRNRSFPETVTPGPGMSSDRRRSSRAIEARPWTRFASPSRSPMTPTRRAMPSCTLRPRWRTPDARTTPSRYCAGNCRRTRTVPATWHLGSSGCVAEISSVALARTRCDGAFRNSRGRGRPRDVPCGAISP